MKAKYISIFAGLAFTACMTTSCSDDSIKDGSLENGQLRTSSILPEVKNAEMIISDVQGGHHAPARSSYNISQFIVTVTNSIGETVATWSYGSMPSLPTFPVGEYTVTVMSHEVQPTAWEAPLFLGRSETFQIKHGEITDIEPIVCQLANIGVSVNFDDELVAASAGDINVTVTSIDAHSLTFTPSETRKGYFQDLGHNTMEVHFTGTINGYKEDFRYVLGSKEEVKAGQHRKISFSLKSNTNPVPDEFGDVSQGAISVETSVSKVDLTDDIPVEDETLLGNSDRPGKEEWKEDPGNNDNNDPQPADWEITFTCPALDPLGLTLNDNIPYTNWTGDFVVNISSTNGFKSLTVTIKSDGLSPDVLGGVNLSSAFDLASGKSLVVVDGEKDKDLTEGLQSLGFPVKEQITGEGVTSVDFNITEFVPLLNIYKGNSDFIIEVTDTKGNIKSQTLKFVE